MPAQRAWGRQSPLVSCLGRARRGTVAPAGGRQVGVPANALRGNSSNKNLGADGPAWGWRPHSSDRQTLSPLWEGETEEKGGPSGQESYRRAQKILRSRQCQAFLRQHPDFLCVQNSRKIPWGEAVKAAEGSLFKALFPARTLLPGIPLLTFSTPGNLRSLSNAHFSLPLPQGFVNKVPVRTALESLLHHRSLLKRLPAGGLC